MHKYMAVLHVHNPPGLDRKDDGWARAVVRRRRGERLFFSLLSQSVDWGFLGCSDSVLLLIQKKPKQEEAWNSILLSFSRLTLPLDNIYLLCNMKANLPSTKAHRLAEGGCSTPGLFSWPACDQDGRYCKANKISALFWPLSLVMLTPGNSGMFCPLPFSHRLATLWANLSLLPPPHPPSLLFILKPLSLSLLQISSRPYNICLSTFSLYAPCCILFLFILWSIFSCFPVYTPLQRRVLFNVTSQEDKQSG